MEFPRRRPFEASCSKNRRSRTSAPWPPRDRNDPNPNVRVNRANRAQNLDENVRGFSPGDTGILVEQDRLKIRFESLGRGVTIAEDDDHCILVRIAADGAKKVAGQVAAHFSQRAAGPGLSLGNPGGEPSIGCASDLSMTSFSDMSQLGRDKVAEYVPGRCRRRSVCLQPLSFGSCHTLIAICIFFCQQGPTQSLFLRFQSVRDLR